ncbi:Crp/Fnr family transcriptional regulator [Flavihumibacter sp. RY-1]|uniref:Crp/Fnr family transcriptional regulator n=1 Tax=Flavihumibacter fluminis TaxID=2909236 RepID=A0ABS9BI61_9BACT|nr:Crp/Fnr family transcriptional regulator [Flavihumibacter fluminis]MCF1715291.1 Crp/Fnr family transcriptional regulator [Flavihumibacter fluminis]
MFSALFKYSAQLVSFTREEQQIIESYFSVRQVPKKFTLIQNGKIARELYFINKGLLRLYYSKDTEDITAFIFREHLFASSYDSFLRQAPSIQGLDTLEDSELLVITYDDLNTLYKKVPRMETLARKIAEQRFINAQQILSSYILDSPEERWKKFEAINGDLLLRVPHHMIASFLGITPVSLSRIRKRLQGS